MNNLIDALRYEATQTLSLHGLKLHIAAADALTDLQQQLEAAQRRIAELEKDAARYRWLREHYGLHNLPLAAEHLAKHDISYRGVSEALDAAVDAAMGEK